MRHFISILIAALSLIACSTQPKLENSCEPRLRAVIHLESSAVTMAYHEIAACAAGNRSLRVLDDSRKTDVPFEATKDADGNLSLEAQNQALAAIAGMRDQALALVQDRAAGYKAVDFAVVASQSVVTATNIAVFAEKVKALGVALTLLSPEQQGELEYRAVENHGVGEMCKGQHLVVWETGTQTMQVSTRGRERGLHVEKVPYGTNQILHKLLAELPTPKKKKTCPVDSRSPNPIGWMNSTRAEKLSEDVARASLTAAATPNSSTDCVVGVGDVQIQDIELAIRRSFPAIRGCICSEDLGCSHFNDSYTRKELQCLALYLSEKSNCDPEIKGPLAASRVSNVYLALGFLEYSKLNQVNTMNISLANELVIESAGLPWQTVPIASLDSKKK